MKILAKFSKSRHTPDPPDPVRRRTLLPGQVPKSGHEDPAAPAMVEAIRASAAYRLADEDIDYLCSDETRGVRLQLDYHKAETLLRRHRIDHTIVVFGSTRIPEPASAAEHVARLVEACARAPQDDDLARDLRIAKRVLAKSAFYDIARDFGRLAGRWAQDDGGRLMLVTGGGPGLMEAANRGAHDVGAMTGGLNITLPREQFPNPYVTLGLCFRFHYFAIRKLHFLQRARALVVFPGGFGTMDELFETLTLIQSRKIAPLPVILVGEAFWRGVFDPDFLVDEGVIDPEDRQLFWFAETAQDIWDDILAWYERAGRRITGEGGRV